MQLDDVLSAVHEVATRSVEDLHDVQLTDDLVTIRRLADLAEAAYLAHLSAFHIRGLGQADGLSTRAWLRHRANVSPGEATRAIKTAVGLTQLPVTQAALTDGTLRPAHAAAMGDAAVMLGIEAITAAEPALVDACRQVDPAKLRTTLRGYGAAVDDPRSVRAAEHRDENCWLDLSTTFDGAVAIQGVLGQEDGALVKAAIGALTTPAGPDDTRTASQRRADGLVEVCRRQLAGGALPVTGGERPNLTVITDLATLEARTGGHGALPDGSILRGESVRRLACDAKITRLIVDSRSMPLDVGRAQRTVTPWQRKALRARDGGCVFPGCHRPADWCDAHHVNFWSLGGRTDIDELVLLCRKHHTLIHHGHWRIRIVGPGAVMFSNPAGQTIPPADNRAADTLLARLLALDDDHDAA